MNTHFLGVLCISWYVWMGFSAADRLPLPHLLQPLLCGFTASLGLGQTLPVLLAWPKEERLVGRPRGLVPTGQCFAVGSHHGTIQLAYWKRVNVCPSSLILRLAPPRNRSVCFHHAEMRFLLAWRSLISSDGGGGCPWMASRSCPLLAGSCIGGWKWGPRSCGFCLGAYGANRPLFPRGTLKWKGNYDKRPYYQSWRTEQPSLSFLE